jgi:hypothetical protein
MPPTQIAQVELDGRVQYWMICIRGRAQEGQLSAARIRRSGLLRRTTPLTRRVGLDLRNMSRDAVQRISFALAQLPLFGQKSTVPSPARLRPRPLCGEQEARVHSAGYCSDPRAIEDHQATGIDHACLLVVCSSAPVRPVSGWHYAAGNRDEVRTDRHRPAARALIR